MSEGHLNDSSVKIGQNTGKSSGDFRRLAVTVSSKRQSADAGVKNSQKSKMIIIIIIIISTCRLCEPKTKSTDHLVSRCPIVTLIEYKEKHNKIGHYIHWTICKYYGIPKYEKFNQPESITEGKIL